MGRDFVISFQFSSLLLLSSYLNSSLTLNAFLARILATLSSGQSLVYLCPPVHHNSVTFYHFYNLFLPNYSCWLHYVITTNTYMTITDTKPLNTNTKYDFVFNWNHFEMRLLNLRINFYLLRTFSPQLGSFCVVSSFTTFRPNFTSGLLQVIYRDLR